MKYEQSFCKALGNYGCYFLCILDIAKEVTKKEYNILEIAEQCINKGYIYFNKENYNDKDNFFVKEPHKILGMITNKKWTVRKENKDYVKKENEYSIEFWSKNGIDGHFARISNNFNSLQNSSNVRTGKIHSYRIFKEV